MLSADERAAFDARGVVCLRGAVDAKLAGALRERVEGYVVQHGLVPKSPPSGFAVTPSKTASIWRALGFAEVWGERVLGALDDVIGRGAWHVPKQAGQLLAMANPQPDARWDVPAKVWHLDYMAPGAARRIPGLQGFLCLDAIDPGGGGTLVAAGVHRFVDAIRRRAGPDWPGRSADVRSALKRELPWLRDLCGLRPAEDRIARFMATPTPVGDGGALQVVELTGEPGDVWLMHPWLLHAPAPSCGARPRMALTERLRVNAALG